MISMFRLFALVLWLAAQSGTISTTSSGDSSSAEHSSKLHVPSWIVNQPAIFSNGGAHGDRLIDMRNDTANMTFYSAFVRWFTDRVDGFTDGENVDAIEHYFWGIRNGLSMELGALDGSKASRSMTVDYEREMDWKRILIDGDPIYRTKLPVESPLAFSVNAAICEKAGKVHFAPGEYIGGIVEFMSEAFMGEYHKNVFKSVNPYIKAHNGSLEGFNWADIKLEKERALVEIDCLPLSTILHKAKVRHINYFILDVEGGELNVLRSIDWAHIKFDVLCIETEPSNRPPGYADAVTAYLVERGYVAATKQIGRNIWYIRKDFVPYVRPGIAADCYNGYRHSDWAERRWANKRTAGAWSYCPYAE